VVSVGVAAKEKSACGLLKTIKSFCKFAYMELSPFLEGRKG
jgi:hypothetical protein